MKTVVGLILWASLPVLSVSAQTVPALVNYQGKLTNDSGDPISNRTYRIEFRIWEHSNPTEGVNLIWGESYDVFVTDGRFNILLGSGGTQVTNPVQPAVNDIRFAFGSPARYLGITLLTDENGMPIAVPEEIEPRQQFLSAPYAVQAENADNAALLDNLDSTDFASDTNFPAGAAGNAQALFWNDSRQAELGPVYWNSTRIGIGEASPHPDTVLHLAGGSFRPSVGGGRQNGIVWESLSGTDDFGWVQLQDEGGGRNTLAIGVENDSNDDVLLSSTGDIVLNASHVDVNGAVSMFGPLQARSTGTDYTADTDGLLIVYVFNLQMELHINGSRIAGMETDEDDGNDNMSGSFPIAKGEQWRVNKINTASSGFIDLWWRPIGL